MALTATQYTRLRDKTGGRTTTNDKDHLTDAELQDEYDDAGSWDTAVVYVLRRRVGMAAVYTDKTMDINSASLNQRYQNMLKLLAQAEAVAGAGGYALEVGTIDLNIDTDSDDLDI
jgi:hypothetical protein